MSAVRPLDVDALKNPVSEDKSVVEGYVVHQKFLPRVYALGNSNPNIKAFLERIDFYNVNPLVKIEKLKANIDAFFAVVQSAGLTEYLVEPRERAAIQALWSREGRAPLANVREQALFRTFLFQSHTLKQEISEGMTVDVERGDIQRSVDKNDFWKLHINIDTSKRAENTNTQTKVDIAYNILLEAAKQFGITNLKLVAPFEKINDMWGREISIYLKGQNSKEGAEKIRQFISVVEGRFQENGIIATPRHDDANVPQNERRDPANKEVLGSQYFSFRNEYANNPRKYFSAKDAGALTDFLTAHHKELSEYYNADASEKAEKLRMLVSSLGSLLTDEKTKLYNMAEANSSVTLETFFEQNFPDFLRKNINSSLQDFLNPPHSAHNPFKLTDNFQLETLNLRPQASPLVAPPTSSSSSSSSSHSSFPSPSTLPLSTDAFSSSTTSSHHSSFSSSSLQPSPTFLPSGTLSHTTHSGVTLSPSPTVGGTVTASSSSSIIAPTSSAQQVPQQSQPMQEGEAEDEEESKDDETRRVRRRTTR